MNYSYLCVIVSIVDQIKPESDLAVDVNETMSYIHFDSATEADDKVEVTKVILMTITEIAKFFEAEVDNETTVKLDWSDPLTRHRIAQLRLLLDMTLNIQTRMAYASIP